ncbi:glycoside hydrolase family 6 protein [Streptomyces chengmaiensis]
MYFGHMGGRFRGVLAMTTGVATVLSLAGCSADDGGDPPSADGGKRAARAPYWVNPDGNAARQAADYRAAGESRNAELIQRIAQRPVAEWIGPGDPEAETRRLTDAAAAVDREALLVLYNIPHRDCGQFSRGGAPDGDAYRAWVDQVARGIGDRRATVILEPDAVLHLVDSCTPPEFHGERYALLSGAIARLKQQPHTTVYLDAGNAGWSQPDALHEPLRRAGIERADGFAVNVSNFYPTDASIAFGKALSSKVGGKHFVIDTSRNGNGPYTGADPSEDWCNPPGRALGEPPTTRTADALVDAYLWIKRPGESDGDCRGGPPAGGWWPRYALELARNAK